MDIPNRLTIASTSNKRCSQYAGVSLTEVINENALSLSANLSIVRLILFLTVPAVTVPGLVSCITNFTDEREWCCSDTDLEKNR